MMNRPINLLASVFGQTLVNIVFMKVFFFTVCTTETCPAEVELTAFVTKGMASGIGSE